YLAYLIFIRSHGVVDWRQMLPMQMCDWGMVVVSVAMWTGSQRWFEVAYFWGIGGTLQAVLTPNLRYGFPDWRFISFFRLHSGFSMWFVFRCFAPPVSALPDVHCARMVMVGVLFRGYPYRGRINWF